MHPYGAADDKGAGSDHTPVDRDGTSDLAGSRPHRTAMGDARRIDRKLLPADCTGIPYRSVDDDATETTPPRIRDHDLADDRIGEIAAGIDHHDVSAQADVERPVNHPIVARPGLNREAGSAQHSPGVIGPQPRSASRQSRHAVAGTADRNGPG